QFYNLIYCVIALGNFLKGRPYLSRVRVMTGGTGIFCQQWANHFKGRCFLLLFGFFNSLLFSITVYFLLTLFLLYSSILCARFTKCQFLSSSDIIQGVVSGRVYQSIIVFPSSYPI